MSLILPIILKNILEQISIKEEWIPDQYKLFHVTSLGPLLTTHK